MDLEIVDIYYEPYIYICLDLSK